MSPEARYQEEIRLLQGQDQYNIKTNDFKTEVKLSFIEFDDIFNFLVVQTSFYTEKQMKSQSSRSLRLFHEWLCYRGEVKKYGNRILILARVSKFSS